AGEQGEEYLEYASAVAKTWPHLTGWKMELKISGATHMSFCDDAACYKLVGALSALDRKQKRFGTIDPLRMMAVQSKYLKAFFDFVLKGGSDDIFRSPDPEFPEVMSQKGVEE